MILKPRPRRILVFAIRGKKKFGGLYVGVRGDYGAFHEVQPVWFAAFGDDCRIMAEGAAVGRKGYVVDAFELEMVPASAWAKAAEVLPEIARDEILAEAALHDGTITANIIHENSVFGLEEDPWTPPPPSLLVLPNSEPRPPS
jgi:hypothetical protein